MSMTSAKPTPLPDIDVDEPEEDDIQFWSVTTVLKALANRALEYYAISQCAQDAIDNQETWRAMLTNYGRDEAIKWLCAARYRKPKVELGADQLGTVVHKLCEQYALTGVKPSLQEIEDMIVAHAAITVNLQTEIAVVSEMLDQFDRWLQRFTPVYEAAEMAVYSQKYGYAGSLDAIFSIDGVKMLTDYKTRRKPLTNKGGPQLPYGETALQLSAYRYADTCAIWRARRVEQYKRRYYLLSNTENSMAVPVPEVDGGLCVIITPQSCEAYPLRIDEEIFRFFLHTFECFRWEEDVSRRVVASALVEGSK